MGKKKPRKPKPRPSPYAWLLLAGVVSFGLAGCAPLETVGDWVLGTDEPAETAIDTDKDGFSDNSFIELVDDVYGPEGATGLGIGVVGLWLAQRLKAARQKQQAAKAGGAS